MTKSKQFTPAESVKWSKARMELKKLLAAYEVMNDKMIMFDETIPDDVEKFRRFLDIEPSPDQISTLTLAVDKLADELIQRGEDNLRRRHKKEQLLAMRAERMGLDQNKEVTNLADLRNRKNK
ncbi:MAG: hypothetical protein ABID45_02405 [Patescibacteria group bacterium]